jgi:hypothetical protein
MPRQTPRLDDTEDIKQWIAGHDARCEELWAHQRGWNEKTEKMIGDCTSRLSSIERKVMFWAGAAAAGGGLLGTIVAKVFGA